MPNIEQIADYLLETNGVPELDSEEYRAWVECRDVAPFLESLAVGDVPVLITMPHVYVYAMLVPTGLLTNDYRDDLKNWNFGPSEG
jgi:hypothetical protein